MIKAFSYGGGVQSTAALVLAAQGRIDYPTFLFCNVGVDSENPKTLQFVRDYAIPYAVTKGIDFYELHHTRNGQTVTLYQQITRPEIRSIGIPVRMSNGAPGNRSCTLDFKIRVVDRWLRSRNAKIEGATVGLGISLDEFQRMRNDSGQPWKKLDYPLIDLRLTRQDCMNIIRDAGLPIPTKSSCWFCPFHSLRAWQEMREQEPELFQRACNLESYINEKRVQGLQKDKVWFTRKLIPLMQATSDHVQGSLFEDDMCESGYCMV